MAFMHPKILHLAAVVRKWAEKKSEELGHSDDLCGMCAVASHRLHVALQKVGVKNSRIVYTRGHAYVKVGPRVIDVTATQFGHPKEVAVGKEGAPGPDQGDDNAPIWLHPRSKEAKNRHRKPFSDPNKFIAHQQKEGWPKEQIGIPESPSFESMAA